MQIVTFHNYLIHLIWREIPKHPDGNYTIQWIPGHCGSAGNEKADTTARAGCYDDELLSLPITFSDGRLLTKQEAFRDWQIKYNNSSRTKGILHFTILPILQKVTNLLWFYRMPLNGTEIKLLTRLRTRHGMCGLRRFQFKLEPTYFCMNCHVPNDLNHIMFKCTKYAAHRSKYKFNIVETLTEIFSCANLKTLKDLTKT